MSDYVVIGSFLGGGVMCVFSYSHWKGEEGMVNQVIMALLLGIFIGGLGGSFFETISNLPPRSHYHNENREDEEYESLCDWSSVYRC